LKPFLPPFPTSHLEGTATMARYDDREPALVSMDEDAHPRHIESERLLIGSCFLSDNVVDDTIELGFLPSDMYRVAHMIIWEAIVKCHETGKPVEFTPVFLELKRQGQLEQVGGERYIEEIVESTPHAASAAYYAQVVIDHAMRRGLIDGSTETIKQCRAHQDVVTDIAFDAEQRLFAVSERAVGSQLWNAEKLVDEATARWQMREDGVSPGIPIGLADVDAQLGGLKPGQLIVVGARPGSGKTSLGLHAMDHLAADQKKSVLFFSLEMGRQEIADRLVCMIAGVDSQKFNLCNFMNEDERMRIRRGFGRMLEANFLIDDTSSRNPSQISAIARRVKRKPGLDLVIIDYLNLIEVPSSKKDPNRQEQVAQISRKMKILARDLFVPVLLLCQLNREVEKREVKRPRLADLRESGAIEQDADVVLMIHRPELGDPNDQPGVAEIVIAKNRNGPTGVVPVAFDKICTRFSNLSRHTEGGKPY
jgi:replicative DNA helicase